MSDAADEMLGLMGISWAEVQQMEAPFTGGSLFKYLPIERRPFFSKPQIRFTQKGALNDPFELSKRWTDFASNDTQTGMAAYIENEVRSKLTDDQFIIDYAKQEFAKRLGAPLAASQLALLEEHIQGPAFNAQRAEIARNLEAQISSVLGFLFSPLGGNAVLERIIQGIGIFSASDSATNEQLWGLYASSGKGFVVEFDANHQFFRILGKNTSAFRRVKYTDERVPAFMSNPYFLFLVKNRKWEFESEWRMTKKLSECDEEIAVGRDQVFLCNVKPQMIKTIIFGYNYEIADRAADVINLAGFDSNIRFKQALVNADTGQLEVTDLSA